MAALQAFLAGPGDAHKRHLEMLRQVILGGGGGAIPTPTPGPGPGPEPEPGPTPEAEEKELCFYDWDGTRLYSYTYDEAQALSALPSLPDHTADGLTNAAWNWTLADIKAHMQTNRICDVGATYETADQASRLVVDVPSYHLGILLRLNGGNLNPPSVRVDWGDGTEETVQTAAYNPSETPHTYAEAGSYTITVYRDNGINVGLGYSGKSAIEPVWMLREAYVGKSGTEVYLKECRNLTKCCLPTGGIKVKKGSFAGMYGLVALVIPAGSTMDGSGADYTNPVFGKIGAARVEGCRLVWQKGAFEANGSTYGAGNMVHSKSVATTNYRNEWAATGGRAVDGSMIQAPGVDTRLYIASTTTATIFGGTTGSNCKAVRLPDNLQTIKVSRSGVLGFADCDLVVPASVTAISDAANSGSTSNLSDNLSSFRSIHMLGSVPPTSITLSSVSQIPVFVPPLAVNVYKNATNWSSHADWIFADDQEG